MGLSRKLGGAVSSRPDPPERVDYQWSTQAYTMREILARFQLPCVVKCSGDAGTVLWAHFRFDMRQPLLLHAARTVRKVHARSLKMEAGTGQMEEFGPPLAIPEDYDGWFFPVNHKDPTLLPRHLRIEGVAASGARKFLVTTALPAFTPRKGPESGTRHVAHEVGVGEVLTKVGVVKGEPSGGGSASPSALVQRSRQSLRCVDESRHEVIIPFSHRSLMFDVAENYGQGRVGGGRADGPPPGAVVPGVVSTCTLVTSGNACLPRVFRHVLGDPPALTDVFTGLLRCYSVFTEETVMAATMSRLNLASVSEQPACLELGTDSTARFNIALNASDLKKTNQYNAALRTCEELAPSYVRAIKTSFTVHPVVSDLDDVDLSLYEAGHAHVSDSMGMSSGQSSVSDAGKDGAINNAGDYVNIASVSNRDDATGAVDDDCDESMITDDVDSASTVETNSMSDAQSCDIASISDVVEVDANSEFDISWGQLRRARSFSGSISSDNTVSSHSATIHSDSEDSESSVVVKDDTSSISQDSLVNRDDNSSTSQDTVVLRQSRLPSTESSNLASGSLNNDTDTVSEVSSFGEADIDGMFRRTSAAQPDPSSSEMLAGVEDIAGDVEGDEEKIWWGDDSSGTTIERPRSSWSSHYDSREREREQKSGSKQKSKLGQTRSDAEDFILREAGDQRKIVNGNGHPPVQQSESAHATSTEKKNLTEPYLEIPRSSRMKSHPEMNIFQQPGEVSAFSHFHPQSASMSTSRARDMHKSGQPQHSESDPNLIRERDDRNNEGQIDLEFVRSLGEKLLAVSMRSSTPKYQRLETEQDLLRKDVTRTDDEQSFKRRLRQSNSVQPVNCASNRIGNSADIARGADNPHITDRDWQKCVENHNVLLDGLDLLEEEAV